MAESWVSRTEAALSALQADLRLAQERETDTGRLSCRVGSTPWTITCPADTPGAQQLLTLAASMAEELRRSEENLSPERSWQRLLEGRLPQPQQEALLHRWPLRESPCRVLCLQSDVPDAAALTRELAPLRPGELLLPMENGQAALVISDSKNLAEAEQYALALGETVLTEAGHTLRVGISQAAAGGQLLPESWTQACEALRLGQRFHPGENVHCHERLLVERLLQELPAETRSAYHQLLCHRKNSRGLNEELLGTVNAFFQADLNLSDAARQLYIHRNTLVYRLEKAQKLTGLDVRHFDDAMTFRLLMMLGEPSGEAG